MKLFAMISLSYLICQLHGQDAESLIQINTVSQALHTYSSGIFREEAGNCQGQCYSAWSTPWSTKCAYVNDVWKPNRPDYPCSACPECAAFQPAGAYGDPHCVNAKGEWFDLHAVGQMPMVILPRGAMPEEADIAVVATTISPEGWDTCAPTFISTVEILLNHDRERLRIEAVQGQAFQVKESNTSTAAYWLEVGTDEVVMKKNSLAVKVILHKVPTSEQTQFLYLDMEVTGLQSVNAGGILGADSHDFAMKKPDGCDSTAMMKRHTDVKRHIAVRASSARAV